MKPISLKEIVIALKGLDNIEIAYLYGSYLKQPERAEDLDIGIVFKEGEEGLDSEIELSLYLERRLKVRPVEIKILNKAPLFFQYKVIKEGKLIYSKDEKKRIAYEVNLTNNYLDFKPLLDYYNRCMYRTIKEEAGGSR